MFDFADAIKSVGEAFTSLFNYCTTAKEVQSETQVIKDKKRLKKATDIAEKMFAIVDKYLPYFNRDDQKDYNRLYEEFKTKN